MALSREVTETLKIYGLKFDRSKDLWVSERHKISAECLAELQPFEVEQVLAAIRDGAVEVSLGPNKTVRFANNGA